MTSLAGARWRARSVAGLSASNVTVAGAGKRCTTSVALIVERTVTEDGDFGVALIGHPRTGRYYFSLGMVDDRDAVANLSQARLFDTKRLIRKIGMLDERTFRELAKALALTLFPFLPLDCYPPACYRAARCLPRQCRGRRPPGRVVLPG